MGNDAYYYEKYLSSDYFYKHDDLADDSHDNRVFTDDSLIMINKNKFNSYKNNNLLDININNKHKTISKDLLVDIICDYGMFKYLMTRLDKDNSTAISILLLDEDSLIDNIIITKAELVDGLKQMSQSLFGNYYINVIIVYSLTNNNTCNNRYYDQVYTCEIDGEEYTISALELIKILTCSNKEFKKYLNDQDNLPYSKETTIYMLVDFCEKESIFDKYSFEPYIYDRYMELKNQRIVDYESVNKLNKSDDKLSDGRSLLYDIEISKELYDEVINDINKEYNPLEQAIYVYIRLCDLLTYNEDSLIDEYQDEINREHRDLNYISNITPSNNRVLSHEFAIIYAKFLNILDIKYSLKLISMGSSVNYKSTIKFKHGEYLVDIDLFSDLIKNDMTMVKIGGTLNSIKSINKNEVTYRKFEEKVYEIYSNYKDSIKRREEFLNNISMYKREYYRSVASKKDKLKMIFKQIARTDLKGMDSINYIKETITRIIGNDEDIEFELLSTNDGGRAKPVILIKYNDINYLINVNDKNGDIVKDYSDNALNYLLYTNQLIYIDNKTKSPNKEGYRHDR